MRWRMCPRCGTKMLFTLSDLGLDIFTCHVCKQAYTEINGELMKYKEEKKKLKELDADEFLIEILDRMSKDEENKREGKTKKH